MTSKIKKTWKMTRTRRRKKETKMNRKRLMTLTSKLSISPRKMAVPKIRARSSKKDWIVKQFWWLTTKMGKTMKGHSRSKWSIDRLQRAKDKDLAQAKLIHATNSNNSTSNRISNSSSRTIMELNCQMEWIMIFNINKIFNRTITWCTRIRLINTNFSSNKWEGHSRRVPEEILCLRFSHRTKKANLKWCHKMVFWAVANLTSSNAKSSEKWFSG